MSPLPHTHTLTHTRTHKHTHFSDNLKVEANDYQMMKYLSIQKNNHETFFFKKKMMSPLIAQTIHSQNVYCIE